MYCLISLNINSQQVVTLTSYCPYPWTNTPSLAPNCLALQLSPCLLAIRSTAMVCTSTGPIFHSKNHQSKTMFDYVIASLSPEVAAEIRDLILSPPAENPYDVLKEQLVKRTAASEQKRLQQLFSSEELGDHKPTQLLCRLQSVLTLTHNRPFIMCTSMFSMHSMMCALVH